MLEELKSRAGRIWAEIRGVHPRNPDSWLINAWSGQQTATGIRVDEDVAMRFSAVYSCVRILSETIASLPLITYRRLPGGGKERATDSPLFSLLHDQPNDDQTSFEWREMMQGHLALWGNAYSVIDFNAAGEPSALVPLHPAKVTPRRSDGGKLIYEVRLDGGPKTFSADRILHLRWMSSDGISGISPIELYREAIGLGLAAEEFQSRFFSNDATPSGVLSHPGQLGEMGMANLRDSIDRQTGGMNNKHRFLVLEEGMQWHQIGIPARDSELISSRKFQVQEIARIYRMQLHKIGELENATFSNIEEQNIEHVVDTIRPWAVRWEQTLAMKLVPARDRGEIFVEYLLDGLLRGDSKSRSEFYNKMFQVGAFSPNDILEKENMNPVEGGEQRFVPLNMIPLGDAGRLVSDKSSERGIKKLKSSAPLTMSGEAASALETRSLNSRRRIQGIHKRLFLDAGQRIVTREVNEIGRIIIRDISNRGVEGLNASIDDFYEQFPQVVRDIVMPALLSYGEAIQGAAAEEIGQIPGMTPLISDLITKYGLNLGVRHSISSRKQLKAVIREASRKVSKIKIALQIQEALNLRLAEWAKEKALKIANREVTQAGAAIARRTYRENGIQYLRWVTYGKNCQLCNSLSGKVVGIQANFLNAGEVVDPKDGKTSPLTVRRGIQHPQLHQGCDCMISAA